MASTGFRKATSIHEIVPEGGVTNTDCLLIDSTLNDVAFFGAGNNVSLSLVFDSFNIPPGSTIESINIKFTGQHTLGSSFAHLLLTAFILVDNNDSLNFSNSLSGPTQIATEDSSIESAGSINPASFFNPNTGTIATDLVNGLAGGLTNIRLTFSFNNLSGTSFPDSTGGTVNLVGINQSLGDNLVTPALEIIFTPPPTKVKIQSQPDTFEDDLIIPGLKTKVKLQPSTILSSVESVISGPNSADVLGDVGDGNTYSSPNQATLNRLLETSTGNSAVPFSSLPSGFKIFNFFDSNQIPLNATITGVELIAGTDFDGSGNSRIGSFGGNSGQLRIECYFHNGVNYSDRLSWDTSETYTGITFLDIEGGTSNRASLSGANRSYKNNAEGDDVLFGGPNDLSGLTWNPANQANFGFGFAAVEGSGFTAGGVTRGIRMKVYYQTVTLVPTKVIII